MEAHPFRAFSVFRGSKMAAAVLRCGFGGDQ